LNKSLPTKINSYDLLAVRRLHGTDADTNFVYKHRFGSHQYSANFAKWLLEQHSADPKFFEKCRSAAKTIGTIHAIDDERLLWLCNFMQKNDLRISQIAKRLKISQSTLSRLLAGKYKGDVSGMLQRLESYRTEVEQS
jgi:DNA-directed RNA polymerase specialized sigma subunit